MKQISKEKIKRKIWVNIVSRMCKTKLYPFIYRSYWHYLFYRSYSFFENKTCYYAARPNPGAGIGHQIANWIAGYYYARQFHLKFAHLPFSTKAWEYFLGFGEEETTVSELKGKGYKTRKLPLFTDGNEVEMNINRKIIQSYSGRKIVFIAEQDQFYQTQYGVMNELKKKFYSASARDNQKLLYDHQNFNIAIHVRRGDIMEDPSNPNLAMRYLNNDYFEKVLRQVVDNVKIDRPIHVYFFSQGKPEDYPEFARYANLHWCMDMGAQDSFLHMVYADLLITSKSSFSYKPALLNNGIKVCPKDFWHGYPCAKDWVLVENDGTFNINLLRNYEFESNHS